MLAACQPCWYPRSGTDAALVVEIRAALSRAFSADGDPVPPSYAFFWADQLQGETNDETILRVFRAARLDQSRWGNPTDTESVIRLLVHG